MLLSQLAGVGLAAGTAWQVLLQWYRFRTKNELRLDDASLFQALDDAIANAKANPKAPRKVDFGSAAADSGHAHIFADMKKLPVPMRAMFVEDLARIAAWSGLANKDLRKVANKPWKSLSMKEKARLLGALDWLSFSFVEAIKEKGSERADSWLWQLNEPLPLLANEPSAMEAASKELSQVQKLFAPFETALGALLASRCKELLDNCKEVVKPLDVAAAARKLQVLKLLVEDMGLDSKSAVSVAEQLRARLDSLVLSPQEAPLKSELQAAEMELQDEVSAATKASLAAGQTAMEAASRLVYAQELCRLAASDAIWAPSVQASFPGTRSNVLARKLAMLEGLLAEVPRHEGQEKEVLVATVNKLAPILIAELGLDQAIEVEKKEDAEDAEGTDEAAAEEETVKEQAPRTALSLLGEISSSAAACEELRSALCGAALALLLPPPGPASSRSDSEVVRDLVSGVFKRVLAASGAQVDEDPIDRSTVWAQAASAAQSLSAASLEAAAEKVQQEAEAAGKAALASGLDRRQAGLTKEGTQGEPGESATRLLLATHRVREALAGKDLASAAASALSLLRSEELQQLDTTSRDAATDASRLCEQLSLAGDVASHLQLGEGLTALLTRLGPYLERAELQYQEAAKAAAAAEAEEGEEGEEGEAGEVAAREQAAAEASALAGKAKEAQVLVVELLGQGLVLLDLPGKAYTRLQALRETVDMLRPEMDALTWSRGVTALGEMVSQLGPIGSAVDARLVETSDERRRHQLVATRALAVDIYRALQEFITLDTSSRPEMLKGAAEIKEALFSSKVEKKSATLDTLQDKLTLVQARRQVLADSVAQLPGSTAALSALSSLGGQCELLQQEVRTLLQYVKLREHALGSVPPVCPTDIEVPEFPSLSDTMVHHAEDAVWLEMAAAESEDLNLWCMAGHKLVARGQAALLMLAGGVEGDEPRVTRDVGLPSSKCLLQIYAERLQRIQRLSTEALFGQGAAVVHPMQWYILATPATEAKINQCLQDNFFFGLDPRQVHVFAPDLTVPLLSEEGKVVLEAPHKVARAAGGSGEVFRGLRTSGMLAHMKRCGVRCLDVHAVDDNIMARVADPTFLGYCHSIGLDCAAKVVDPDSVQMTTYGYAMAAGVLPGGGTAEDGPVMERLPGMMPATGQYYFSMRWVNEVDSALGKDPLALYRLSPAWVPSRSAGGSVAKAPGYRLDRSISDFVLGGGSEGGPALVAEQQCGLVVVEPAEEFSLVWGSLPFFAPDTPTSAVEDLLLLHTSWIEAAGGTLGDEEEGVVEVAPLVSYCGEQLEEVVKGREFNEAYELDLQGFTHQPFEFAMSRWLVPFLAGYVVVAALKVAKVLK